MRDFVIAFQLNERSGVATYLQLVQQVVAKLATNPNTVHKAYRELERAGLVRARPGLGTDDIEAICQTAFRGCFAEGVA